MTARGGWTVNPEKGSEVPAGVVTVTVRVPSSACGAMVVVIGTLVEVPLVPTVAVTPVPLKTTAVAPAILEPVTVVDIAES